MKETKTFLKRKSRTGYRCHLRNLERDIIECVHNFNESNINHVS